MKTRSVQYILIASVVVCLVLICVYAFLTSHRLQYFLVKEYENGRQTKSNSGEYRTTRKQELVKHHPALPNCIRAIIIVPSGSGKTQLLLNLIMRWLKWDKLYLVAPSVDDQRSYNVLKDFNENATLLDDDALSENNESDQLYQNVTIFCWILSTTNNLKYKAAAVNNTWAKRCNKYVFIISAEPEVTTSGNNQQTSAYVENDILYINSPEGYLNLVPKVRKVMKYLYEKELHNYDWFLKADDDSYFIIENLRYLLSKHDPSKGLYLGYALEPEAYSKSVLYMSGGAGYVFSREGIKLIVENGYNVGACNETTEFEDLEIGKCAKIAGVTAVNTLDKLDKETFHPDHLKDFIPGPPKAWLNYYAKNKPKGGPDCCSQFSISFHRMSYQDILVFDHLLYKTNVFGRRTPYNDTDIFKARQA